MKQDAVFPGLLACVAACTLVLAPSCLPTDTRPVPGSVEVTATGAGPLLGGEGSLVTADGWTVTYGRFLLSIGRASLDGDRCVDYYDGEYRRLLDLRIPGPQKVSVLYALGPCDLSFGMTGTEADSVLGRGVSEADRAFMGEPGTDAYATDRGRSLYVAGRASKGGTAKTFAWSFRRRVAFSDCGFDPDDRDRETFDLTGGRTEKADLRIHGESLLLDSLEPAAVPRFDVFAAADDDYGDGNGDITLDELGNVRFAGASGADAGGVDAGGVDAASPFPSGGSWATLEERVYLGVAPRLVSFGEGGACRSHVQGGGAPP